MKAIAKVESVPGLALIDAEKPTPGYGEVLIKVKKTAICGTDLHIYKWDDWAAKTVPVPLIIGHEFMGVVEAVGEGVNAVHVGERVSAEGHITCGICRNCRAGHRHLCRSTEGIGYHRTGAFAEYCVMPEKNVYHIPDNISDDQAVLLDPFGNAVHATLEYNLVAEDVLITGAGPIGLMAAAIARHVGARKVVVTDINPVRLKKASKLSCVDVAANPLDTDLREVMKQLGMKEGFDVGLEMSGSEHAFQQMLDVMNTGGKIAYLGIPSKPFSIDWSKLVFSSLLVKGIYGRRMFETWYKGVGMLQSGLDITHVISDRYPYHKFDKAFQAMLKGDVQKLILEW